jgi:hypothetical protein
MKEIKTQAKIQKSHPQATTSSQSSERRPMQIFAQDTINEYPFGPQFREIGTA